MQNWPFPIHNGERTEASKLIIKKGHNPDKNEGSFYLSLENAIKYVPPVDTNEVVASKATNNEEKEAPF